LSNCHVFYKVCSKNKKVDIFKNVQKKKLGKKPVKNVTNLTKPTCSGRTFLTKIQNPPYMDVFLDIFSNATKNMKNMKFQNLQKLFILWLYHTCIKNAIFPKKNLDHKIKCYQMLPKNMLT